MSNRWIEKIGLAVVEDGRLLVLRKRGGDLFILPGGKPEDSETDLAALAREINEELGCTVDSVNLEGVFADVAAGLANAAVVVRLYSGKLVGEPSPRSEIEEQEWLDLRHPTKIPLAPSITNSILPHVKRRWRKGAFSTQTKGADFSGKVLQDLFEVG